MAADPRVTVLLPVYNGGPHLRASIESVLSQSLADFELLVVDDASVDETPEVLDEYARGDDRVRLLRNEQNLGLTATLNRGIRESTAPYIARQDADDLSHTGRLAAQVAHLDSHPEVALLGCAYRRIDDSGAVDGLRPVPTRSTAIRWRLLFISAFAHSSMMIRRSVLEEVGVYDETFRYAQDYELWSRICREHRAEALPDALVDYRRSLSSLTATYEGAGAEIDAISEANVKGVLAAGGQEPSALNGFDRHVAWQLLFGEFRNLDPASARAAVEPILVLQRAFARAHGLSRGTARRHRASTAATLARRLPLVGRGAVSGRGCAAAAAALARGLSQR